MGSKKGGQTIGFHYIMDLYSGFGRGPINELVEIQADDKTAWSGSVTDDTPTAINAPDLFGGEQKEGGIQGGFRLFPGGLTQVLPGAATVAVGTTGPVQNATIKDIKAAIGGLMGEMRGRATFWYHGLVSSMNPYPKTWKFRYRRHTKGWFNDDCWYPEKCVIYLDDGKIHAMNPAHIIYQCLTDPEWGAGENPSLIDENSFILVANTLCSEGFGLCFNWTRQEDVQTFLQVVIDHIGGVLYTDRESGKYVLRLIRNDYDPEDVPLYTKTTGLLKVLEDDSASADDAIDEVIIIGHSPITDKDFEVRDHSIAGRESHESINSKEVEFKGLPTQELGLRVAKRERRVYASGLKKLRLVLDRRAWRLAPGMVIRISAPEFSISNMILRIGEVEHGALENGEINVRAMEDVFGMPSSSFVTPVEDSWEPIGGGAAEPSTQRALIEAGYRDIFKQAGTNIDQVTATDAYIGQLAKSPNNRSWEYDLASQALGETDWHIRQHAPFTHCAALTADIESLDTSITLTDELSEIDVGDAILIGGLTGEICRVDAITGSTLTIARGCADTVPAGHAAGTLVWALDDDLIWDQRTYTISDEIHARVLTRTSSTVLDIASAPEDSVTLVARQNLPFPPGDVEVDGDQAYSLAPTSFYAEPTLTWVHRDRLTQQDQLVEYEAAGVGPEAGTDYTIRVKPSSGGTPLRTVTGITGTTWQYDATMQAADGSPSAVKFELEAVRDSLASWQMHTFNVNLTDPTAPPAWLHPDADSGISFIEGAAYLDGILYSDLSALFSSGWDGSRLDADGYNFGDWTESSVENLMFVSGPLMDRLAAMDWGVRIEMKAAADYYSIGLMGLIDAVDYGDSFNGVDIGQIDAGPTDDVLYTDDWTGPYDASAGQVLELTDYVFAASNEATGWISSLNGDTAVTQAPQSTFTAMNGSIGGDAQTQGSSFHRWQGWIARVHFFPNGKTASEIETIATP